MEATDFEKKYAKTVGISARLKEKWYRVLGNERGGGNQQKINICTPY